MATTEEGKFCLDDGKELYTKTWRVLFPVLRPSPTPRASQSPR